LRAVCNAWTWHETGPEHVEGGLDASVQTVVGIQGPNQERAKDGLTEDMRNFRGREIAADFAASLAELDHLRVKGVHAVLQVDHRFAYLGGREIRLEKGANDGRVASRFLGHTDAERAQEMGHRFIRVAGAVYSVLELGKLHFAEGEENVVFAGKMIEEGAFADVGDISDVFDGSLGEALFSEKLERGAEETFANFCATALTAVGSGSRVV